MLTITIDTGNAAFYGPDGSFADPTQELARILSGLADDLSVAGGTEFEKYLYDGNGNNVGRAVLSDESGS